jgi:hypothetical protein
VQLDHLAVAASNQIVSGRILAVGDEPFGSVVEVGECDCPALLPCDIGEAAKELRIGLGHPDVDLASTGKPDAECKVIGDAEGQQPGLAAGEHLAGCLDDLTLNAAAGDGARELSTFGDGELRADGPWGGAARCHNGGNRDALSGRTPALELLEDLPHGEIVAGALTWELLVPAATSASLAMPSERMGGLCPRVRLTPAVGVPTK